MMKLNVKKYLFNLMIVVIMVLGVLLMTYDSNFFDPGAASKSKVYLTKTSGKIESGKTTTIKLKAKSGVKMIKRTFKSSNKKIATVNSKGRVKGLKTGSTTIKVKVWYTYKVKKKKKTAAVTLKYKVTVTKKKSTSKSSSNNSKSDNSKKDSTKKDDNKKDSTKKDNTKKDNTKKDDTKNNDNKKDNNVTPSNTTITFGQASYTVKEGETIKIDVKAPEGAQLEWSLSNVVDVIDQDGNLTGCGGLFKNARYIIVKDKVSGAEAKCPYTVEVCAYKSPYNYEVAIMGTPVMGGDLHHSISLYIKTDNPGDRYICVDYEVANVDRNKFSKVDWNSVFVDWCDVNDISRKDIKQTRFKSFADPFVVVKNGYLIRGGFSPTGSGEKDGGWSVTDYNETYQYMKESGGKITLFLYEYNPNIKENNFTSKEARKTVVWQKQITVKNFYDELDSWIDNTFVPMALKNKTWNNDFEKAAILCRYYTEVYMRYGIRKNGNEEGVNCLVEDTGLFWEVPNCNYEDDSRYRFPSPRTDSRHGPVMLQYIMRHLGYECQICNGSHITITVDGKTSPEMNASPYSNCDFQYYNIEKHNIDYFLNLYGSSLMASDPITME